MGTPGIEAMSTFGVSISTEASASSAGAHLESTLTHATSFALSAHACVSCADASFTERRPATTKRVNRIEFRIMMILTSPRTAELPVNVRAR